MEHGVQRRSFKEEARENIPSEALGSRNHTAFEKLQVDRMGEADDVWCRGAVRDEAEGDTQKDVHSEGTEGTET